MKRMIAAALLFCAVPAAANPAGEIESCMARTLPANIAPAERLSAVERTAQICAGLAMDARRLDEQEATNAIYANQIVQNRILLFMVVFLTLAGVLLSALQLWASYKLAAQGRGQLAEGGDISLSGGSIAVKSSVVGVVILALSLGFFVVFATEVYRLRPIDVAPEARPRTEGGGGSEAGGNASQGEGAAATAPDLPPAGMKELGR